MLNKKAFTHSNIFIRITYAYSIYIMLVLLSFSIGYFLLPEGVLRSTPYAFWGEFVSRLENPLEILFANVIINLAYVTVLGVGLNLQRVRSFPTGYIFLFAAGLVSGLFAGTNSFVVQAISPYTIEGWIVALKIQHLELLGYTVIIAATCNISISDYSSWLPWKSKEIKIKRLRDIRLTKQEVLGVIIGVLIILVAALNETLFGMAI